MSHAIVEAAAQFQSDERGRKRKRMPAEKRAALERTLHAVEHQVNDPIDWARRGEVAVELFGYVDTFDEKAATVIADILWAVQAHGFQPIDVLQNAWQSFNEDRANADAAARRGE